jgi:hypothetical protein
MSVSVSASDQLIMAFFFYNGQNSAWLIFNEMIVFDDATDYYLTNINFNWCVICIGISI